MVNFRKMAPVLSGQDFTRIWSRSSQHFLWDDRGAHTLSGDTIFKIGGEVFVALWNTPGFSPE